MFAGLYSNGCSLSSLGIEGDDRLAKWFRIVIVGGQQFLDG